MKYCLFLVSLVTSLYLIKAAPVRLQKRAAFYIANETACVVDNIVYSSGDPIPTDDPCEACKCRPPGFACVLKECRPKPGCRAVRRLGECCPEYICGCEHDGKMYRDGEQIIDEQNPCYECHCQGSSIACAFVDCFYRIDCIPVYVPGECCPHYKNCSRDAPERTSSIGDNALPPANLLPELYAPKVPNPPQLASSHSIDSETGDDISNDPVEAQDSDSGKQETELPENENVNPESNANIDVTDDEKGLENEEHEAKENKSGENVKTSLITSNTDLEDREVAVEKISTEVPLEFSTEAKVEDEVEKTQTETTDTDMTESEVEESTEKQDETESTQDDSSVTDKPIKNSASENSKSLKITRDDDPVEESMDVEVLKDDNKDENETVSNGELDKLPENKEIQTDAKTPTLATEDGGDFTSVTVNDDSQPIKKEAAETVKDLVHERGKTELPTATDSYVTSTESPLKISNEESLLKSNNLESSKLNTESSKSETKKYPEETPTSETSKKTVTISVSTGEIIENPETVTKLEDEKELTTEAILSTDKVSTHTKTTTATSEALESDTTAQVQKPKEERSANKESPKSKEGSINLEISVDDPEPSNSEFATKQTLTPESEETTAKPNPKSTEEPNSVQASTTVTGPPAQESRGNPDTDSGSTTVTEPPAQETTENPDKDSGLTTVTTAPSAQEITENSATGSVTTTSVNKESAEQPTSTSQSVEARDAILENRKTEVDEPKPDDEQLQKGGVPEETKAEQDDTELENTFTEAQENKPALSDDLKKEETVGGKAQEPNNLEETKESESSNQEESETGDLN